MPVLPFRKSSSAQANAYDLSRVLDGFSIEMMPRTAAKIDDFRTILPKETRVYIAHIDGTPIDDMVATAARIRAQGFEVMPHIPARSLRDKVELKDWVARYREEAQIDQALVLAGGAATQKGDLATSMQLLETGYFEDAGFTRLHVAGHPEGNHDIDPDGTTTQVDHALALKQEYAQHSSAKMAIVTQFAFEAEGVIAWARRLRETGIDLPIHLGVAGPAKLQTLIKFAIACGVGPSLSVLKRRAKDVSKLIAPFEPNDLLSDLSAMTGSQDDALFDRIHLFPLGGIRASADYVALQRGQSDSGASPSNQKLNP